MNWSVLLIDDNEASNFLHRLAIEETGFSLNIYEVSNAQDGLNFLKEKHWLNSALSKSLLVFLDINMPGFSGWDFLEKYKDLTKEIKDKVIIVMLSTSVNPDDKNRSEQIAEVDVYASKPLTKRKFSEIKSIYF